jgi:hypothetical protein
MGCEGCEEVFQREGKELPMGVLSVLGLFLGSQRRLSRCMVLMTMCS